MDRDLIIRGSSVVYLLSILLILSSFDIQRTRVFQTSGKLMACWLVTILGIILSISFAFKDLGAQYFVTGSIAVVANIVLGSVDLLNDTEYQKIKSALYLVVMNIAVIATGGHILLNLGRLNSFFQGIDMIAFFLNFAVLCTILSKNIISSQLDALRNEADEKPVKLWGSGVYTSLSISSDPIKRNAVTVSKIISGVCFVVMLVGIATAQFSALLLRVATAFQAHAIFEGAALFSITYLSASFWELSTAACIFLLGYLISTFNIAAGNSQLYLLFAAIISTMAYSAISIVAISGRATSTSYAISWLSWVHWLGLLTLSIGIIIRRELLRIFSQSSAIFQCCNGIILVGVPWFSYSSEINVPMITLNQNQKQLSTLLARFSVFLQSGAGFMVVLLAASLELLISGINVIGESYWEDKGDACAWFGVLICSISLFLFIPLAYASQNFENIEISAVNVTVATDKNGGSAFDGTSEILHTAAVAI